MHAKSRTTDWVVTQILAEAFSTLCLLFISYKMSLFSLFHIQIWKPRIFFLIPLVLLFRIVCSCIDDFNLCVWSFLNIGFLRPLPALLRHSKSNPWRYVLCLLSVFPIRSALFMSQKIFRVSEVYYKTYQPPFFLGSLALLSLVSSIVASLIPTVWEADFLWFTLLQWNQNIISCFCQSTRKVMEHHLGQ